ncbi:hypothetical protein NEOLEDRAFT_1102623 [Neolentinus lepideus HHB14362 ss-1]|uniref:Zn(2)-C6 fungal-type domain-containing protein n=1 Tax=Neolentinus lepideus HHB14362 ss-1 TaxID=1314782 RepID=A0A165N3J4_9AGAM|nr:hypothetical protein NEOLEDRAFT_1102623 [Neolentinus lepideus HHB14362 ss-1]
MAQSRHDKMSTFTTKNEGNEEPSAKRLRSKCKPVARACDTCRRKRIRCDGSEESREPCPNCIAFRTECTYNVPLKKHGPPKGYVKLLEARIAKLESLLREDGCNIESEVGAPLNKDNIRRGNVPPASVSPPVVPSTSSPHSSEEEIAPTSVESPKCMGDDSDNATTDDEFIQSTLSPNLAGLSLDPSYKRFLGRSSGISMIKTAIIMKAEDSGITPGCIFGAYRRQQFWTPPSWEKLTPEEEHPDYKFPDPDLMEALIKTYFRVLHGLGPFLHRPTFERNFQEGLHFKDRKFGAILLMVCAVAARYSNDERVFIKEPDSSYSPQSAGWQWFHQVQMMRRSLMARPTLYDLQLYNLFFIFLIGSQAPHAAWVVVGHAIRLAQDVGAHKRKFYGSERTFESELWRRTFWCLVSHERHLSAALGRPYSIEDEEIDVDLPAECDDEYWMHPDPEKAFKQPPDKPSRMQYFTLLMKQIRILGHSLRAIYTSRKYQALFGRNQQDWEQHILADMDSAANQWFDSIPPHLRWMPNGGDPITFRQAAFLHINYYHNQILVHRPFISTKQTPLSLSCLAICNNAARCIISIADALRQRGDTLPGVLAPTFNASMFLLLQAWGSKRSGTGVGPEKAMVEVQKALQILKGLENRWSVAGALWDIVQELGVVSELPLSASQVRASSKRARDEDRPSENIPPSMLEDLETADFLQIRRPDQPSNLETILPESSGIHPAAVSNTTAFRGGTIRSHPEASSGATSQGDLSWQPSMYYSVPDSSSAAAQQRPPSQDIHRQLMERTTVSELYTLSSINDSEEIFGNGFQTDHALSDFSVFSSMAGHYPPNGVSSSDFLPHYGVRMTAAAPSAAQESASTSDAGHTGGFDQDTLTMLSNCPSGFDFEGWGNYIDNLDVFMRGTSSSTDAGGGRQNN